MLCDFCCKKSLLFSSKTCFQVKLKLFPSAEVKSVLTVGQYLIFTDTVKTQPCLYFKTSCSKITMLVTQSWGFSLFIQRLGKHFISSGEHLSITWLICVCVCFWVVNSMFLLIVAERLAADLVLATEIMCEILSNCKKIASRKCWAWEITLTVDFL